METKKKLSGSEKFAYGIGAVGKDMVYMLSASYILYYYQDIMGVKAWIMGVILLIARVFDAFNDPIMGVLVAKTKTKWGKFRPWLFIGTLTNAIILYVMFAAPPTLSGKGLVAYAAVFYILWGVTYTMMDIPYWSMVPAFTDGGKERENLSALARSCAGVGSAIISIVTVIAVSSIGTALTVNSSDKQIINVSSNDVVYEAYILEKDDDGIATGNVLSYNTANATIDVKVTATESVFKDRLYLTGDNTDYSLIINGVSIDEESSKIEFAMDDVNAGQAIIAVYVDAETFASIGENNLSLSADIVSTQEVERVGFKYFTLIIAVLFFVFILITCLVIKEKSTVDVETPSVGAMFKALIQNDQAMAMVITIVLVNTATYITSNLLIYFFKYDLAGKNWQGDYTLFNTFGGGIQIIAMMLFFPLLRKFFNTMKIFYICIVSAVVGYAVLLIMALSEQSSVYPLLVPGFFIMAAVGILNVLVTIFLANTVDYGELKNNRRDESVIFSMQTFVVKLASGVSALVASICLSVFNISEQSDEIKGSVVEHVSVSIGNIKNHVIDQISNDSVVGLRLVMTLVPILGLLIAVMIFKKKYILTDKKLAEISDQLKAKKEN